VLFLLMKHIFDTDYLENHLKEFLEIGKEYFKSHDGFEFFKTILIYLFTTIESQKEKIIQIVNKISKREGEAAMTIAKQLKEEGIKEGKFEDAKKMIKKGYSTEEICDITGLKPAEVEKLKAGK
jgi:predicted transposase/invertase (TIGR01784 family)